MIYCNKLYEQVNAMKDQEDTFSANGAHMTRARFEQVDHKGISEPEMSLLLLHSSDFMKPQTQKMSELRFKKATSTSAIN